MLGIWMGVCLGNRLLVRNYVCLYARPYHTQFLFCLTKVKHVVLSTWMGEHLETASAIFILNFSLLSVSNEGAWVKLQLPHTCKCTNMYTEQGNPFHRHKVCLINHMHVCAHTMHIGKMWLWPMTMPHWACLHANTHAKVQNCAQNWSRWWWCMDSRL